MKELKTNLTDNNYKKLLYLMKDYDERRSNGKQTTIDDMINTLIEREHWVFSQKDMPAK